MANPGPRHWKAGLRVLGYLYATLNQALVLGGIQQSAQPVLKAYTDSNFADSPDHGHSITGYTLYFGDGCFSWASRRQTAIALSTGEAEYYATGHTAREIVWFRELLREIKFPQLSPTPLFVDNHSALNNITSNQVTRQNKQIKVTYHAIKGWARTGELVPHVVALKDNCADIFTKGLHGPEFRRQAAMLGLVDQGSTR